MLLSDGKEENNTNSEPPFILGDNEIDEFDDKDLLLEVGSGEVPGVGPPAPPTEAGKIC